MPGGRPTPIRPQPLPGTGKPTATPTSPSLTGGGGSNSGGGGLSGGPPDSNPELLVKGGGPTPEFIIRDFTAGMHCNPTRDAIGEQDLWWMENLQPLASGNCIPSTAPQGIMGSPTLSGETQLPFYTQSVFINNSPYIFCATFNGNGWIVNVITGATTKIVTGLSASVGTVAVCSYQGANQGILIISNLGYWDYNVTTSNTLTSWVNSISGGTITFAGSVAGGVSLTNDGIAGGTGGSIVNYYQVYNVAVNAAGTGYVVGDTLSLTDGSPGSGGVSGAQFDCQLLVATIGGGGAIATVTIANPGSYAGPATGATLALPTGNTVSGGTGTGATFTIHLQAIQGKTFVISPGNGYTTGTVTHDKNGATVYTTTSITSSGLISGTSIATYAGRVWIGSGNKLFATNINSYNYFGGAGLSSTFSDSYLINGITALFAGNNYLYIFAAGSVDVLSNVTINATTGLTSFTRINVLLGLGVNVFNTMSIVGYARGVGFMDSTGYYLLAGATPERVSERWQAVARVIPSPTTLPLTSAAVFNYHGELCLGVQVFNYPDSFVGNTTTTRTAMFVFQRHRWWVHTTTYGVNSGPVAGIGFSGVNEIFMWALSAGNVILVTLLPPSGTQSSWTLRTKLWDGGAPYREKQAINFGLSAVWTNPANPTGVTFALDSEIQNSSATALPAVTLPGANNYALDVLYGLGAAQGTGSQFIGITLAGDGTNVKVIEGLALRGKQERNMLE